MTDGSTLTIAPGIAMPVSLLRFSFARSSGPGGQNVNKLNTKAVLVVALDDLGPYLPAYAMMKLASQTDSEGQLQFTSQEHRSQIANRDQCVGKLREALVRALHRPRKRKPTKPTVGSQRRRIEQKKQRGELKRRRSGATGGE
ncbi:MAG: alternative ribosome rescue aminoacyl-tRNA hydrolase ArfB [Phycisphaeraceae bacterium]